MLTSEVINSNGRNCELIGWDDFHPIVMMSVYSVKFEEVSLHL